jgi:hypothetical protein
MVRVELMGLKKRQLDLVWREVFFTDGDHEAYPRWLVTWQRVIEIEKEYSAALTAERDLILSLALRYYPRMARQIMKGLVGEPKPRKSTKKSFTEKIVKFRHSPG